VSDLSSKISLLKNLYGEICLGFSEFEYSGKPIFIKHFTEIENGILSKKKEIFEKDAVAKGLDYKEDKLIFLIKEKLWDREKEVELENLKKQSSDLNLVLKNLIINKQITETKRKIKDCEKRISEIQKEKTITLGFCVEDYIEKHFNESFIYEAFYKNKNLSEKFFTREEFDNLEDSSLSDLIVLLNSFYEKLSLSQVKKVAACPFLMNLFYLCEDNAFYFYGKYVKDLTVFQANLFSQCKYFKSLMQNKAQSSPPEDVAEDPEKMIDWYEMVAASSDSNKNEEMLGVSYVGASKEELKKMAGGNAIDMAEMARKSGNKLTKEDFIKMHGI